MTFHWSHWCFLATLVSADSYGRMQDRCSAGSPSLKYASSSSGMVASTTEMDEVMMMSFFTKRKVLSSSSQAVVEHLNIEDVHTTQELASMRSSAESWQSFWPPTMSILGIEKTVTTGSKLQIILVLIFITAFVVIVALSWRAYQQRQLKSHIVDQEDEDFPHEAWVRGPRPPPQLRESPAASKLLPRMHSRGTPSHSTSALPQRHSFAEDRSQSISSAPHLQAHQPPALPAASSAGFDAAEHRIDAGLESIREVRDAAGTAATNAASWVGAVGEQVRKAGSKVGKAAQDKIQKVEKKIEGKSRRLKNAWEEAKNERL